MTCPRPRGAPRAIESGVSLQTTSTVVRAPRTGVWVLVVGVDDEMAGECARAAADVDVGFLRVAHGIAASRLIRDGRPAVVVVAPTLWRDERHAIAEASAAADARMLEVPPFAPASWVAIRIVRTALGAHALANTA